VTHSEPAEYQREDQPMTTAETVETAVPETRPAHVKVSDVEGHPVYFDSQGGRLFGDVRGQIIEHKTYSTLRRLMYAAHLETLHAIPALVVPVPSPSHYRNIAQPKHVDLVAADSRGWHGASRLIAADGSRIDGGTGSAYAVIPDDADADQASVVAFFKGIAEEHEREEQRHHRAMLEISQRTHDYAARLREEFPESAMYDRLAPNASEPDRRAHDQHAYASRSR
jgi:hypothetical protein